MVKKVETLDGVINRVVADAVAGEVEQVRGFITGSYRYGTPTPKSDLDLVILVDEATQRQLLLLGEDPCSHDYSTIRFGMLNIIALTDRRAFDTWRATTEKLAEIAKITPVPREAACKAFREALGEDEYVLVDDGADDEEVF